MLDNYHLLFINYIQLQLPLDYTWQMVKERLSRMGDVDFCDIIQPGVARISFHSVRAAEQVTGWCCLDIYLFSYRLHIVSRLYIESVAFLKMFIVMLAIEILKRRLN
jgi:hypothetical protein